MRPMYKLVAFSYLGLLSPFVPYSLWGQEVPSPSQTVELPLIVVTAKESSQVQSIEFLDKRDLEETNVQTAADIVRQAPNVSVNTFYSFPGTTYTVRGVGENILLLNNDLRPSVSQYIDDIPSVDTLDRNTPLLNLTSAQFYRGPQETLFGAPSPAGALNMYTVTPTNNWSGSVDYQYGSYEFQQLQPTINAPLIKDHLYLGFSGNFSEQNGYITNLFDNSKVDGYQKRDGLLRLIWTPSKEWEIGLYGGLGDFTQSNFYDLLPLSQEPNYNTLNTSYNGYNVQRYNLEAFRILWHLDGFDLLSVTSRQARNVNDLENTSYIARALPLNLVDSGQDFGTEAFTEELRAVSTDASSDVQWRGGFFFSHRTQDGYNQSDIYQLPLITAAPGTADLFALNDVRDDDYAVYGQLTFHPAEQWEVTSGLRGEIFSEDKTSGVALTSIAGALSGGVAHNGVEADSLTQGTYLPSIQATYRWSENQSSWVKLDKAWRPGGVGIYQIAQDKYTKETSWNAELGHNISFWNDKASITPLLFYSRYQNYQSPVAVTPVITYETNAKYATAQGAELSLSANPWPDLTVKSDLGYTEALYNEFPGGANNGDPVVNIPEYTIDNSASYVYHLTKATDFTARLDYDIVGDFPVLSTDFHYRYKQGAYGLLSARLGYEFDHGGIYFFGANLTDSRYGESLTYSPGLGLFGNPGSPPVLGLEVRASF